ncbi:MAG: dihydrofolate reductase family protein [Solirubrobacteraceae bacterium]
MSAEPPALAPAVLTSLTGDTAGRHLSAAQVVERLRLWNPASPARPVGDRPRVFLNMASTADGRATLEGRSGPIGNRADKELFLSLRTAVDAVLFGAGTARAERYRRLVKDEARRRLRVERGLAAEPLACIVSASLTLSPESVPLLGDPDARVVILTPSAAGELPAGVAPVEYVRAAREGQLDLRAALAELHTRWGVRTVMCEGGPHLNGALLAAGVVDELFLTLAPKLGGGASPQASLRIVCGPDLSPPVELELRDVLESEGCLLLRYGVGGGGAR